MTSKAEQEKILSMLSERYRSARPRGRDMKKLPKPYTCREVVYECSNGWTIERLSTEDFGVEGFFMGHCMGGKHGPRSGDFYSLREPDGTPHATIERNHYHSSLHGRCNAYPKPEYVELINEWLENYGQEMPLTKHSLWGVDTDEEYHATGILSDLDYRDLEHGRFWRDSQWEKKRQSA